MSHANRDSQPRTVKDLFLASLERCLDCEDFVRTFYDRFTRHSPSVRDRFADTNMQQQAEKLARSLRIMASAVGGEPEGLSELRERAETHGARGMKITPDLYELWAATIIVTARDFDVEWSADVERAWRNTIEILVGYMLGRGYQSYSLQ